MFFVFPADAPVKPKPLILGRVGNKGSAELSNIQPASGKFYLLTHSIVIKYYKRRTYMYSYGLLEPNCHYLIQETSDAPVSLIKVTMKSDFCMYVFKYEDELITGWKRKTDFIFDIIECLSDAAVGEWEKHYNNSEDAYYEEDEE